MSTFSATTTDEAVVPAARMAIWAALTDPDLLPDLAPLVDRIDAHGDVWIWHMNRISALGVGITPTFTERMTFDEGYRIVYTHEPPRGATERTSVQGRYDLADVEGGTHLRISLTLHVDLPLPRALAPAVTRVMTGVMTRTGDQFSANLLRHLGVDGPAPAAGAP